MEKWFEEIVILPHVSSFQAYLQVDFVSQADSHDLVEIIASRLCRRDLERVQNCDVCRSIAISDEVKRRGGAYRASATNYDDFSVFTICSHIVYFAQRLVLIQIRNVVVVLELFGLNCSEFIAGQVDKLQQVWTQQ